MTGISVIIPTYNRERFLPRALGSVKAQSRGCDEILVIDDGSIDSTRQCIQTFASRCEIPVSHIYQDNRGPAAARNRGIMAARYSCLAFLDSDDHWHRDKLKVQYGELMSSTSSLISHTRERWFRRGTHLNQKKKHQPGNGDIFRHCLQLCAVGMSTVMVKKELFEQVGLFDEQFRCCEDYDLWLRTSCKHPFLLVDSPLTIKEGGRSDQVSHQYRVGMDRLRISSILKLIREQPLSPQQLSWSFAELRRKCLVYGNGCLKHGRREEGEHYLHLAYLTEKEPGKLKTEELMGFDYPKETA